MDDWIIWLIFAVVLGVVEIFTLTAAIGMLGAAALVTAVFAAVGLPLPVQLIVFTVASTAGVVLIRPAVHRFMHRPQLERFGIEALVGRQAYVVKEVTGRDGRVRIDGEEWTARVAFDDGALVIPVGVSVDVMRISGTTAFVYPRE